MTPRRILVAAIPALAMLAIVLFLLGIERWLAAFGTTDQAKLKRVASIQPHILLH